MSQLSGHRNHEAAGPMVPCALVVAKLWVVAFIQWPTWWVWVRTFIPWPTGMSVTAVCTFANTLFLRWSWDNSVDLTAGALIPAGVHALVKSPVNGWYQSGHGTALARIGQRPTRHQMHTGRSRISWLGGVCHPVTSLVVICEVHGEDMEWAVCGSSSWSPRQEVTSDMTITGKRYQATRWVFY